MDVSLYEAHARLEQSHWWFRGRRAVVQAVLDRHLPQRGLRVLDVGCGTGGMLPVLTPLGKVHAMDASEEALRHARQRAGPEVTLTVGQLPEGLPNGQTYDLVTAFDVLEHLADPVAALKAIRNALRPGGTFLCTVPAFQFLWSQHDVLNHHHRRYTLARLDEHLRAAGFRIGWSSYFNSLLFPPIAAARLARKVLRREESGSDLEEAAPLVNGTLSRVFSSERFLVPRLPLPFGVSLLALATPEDSSPRPTPPTDAA